MICEKCGDEIETVSCPNCHGDVKKLGGYCYLCGALLAKSEVSAERADDGLDLENRILCSDGACIGTVENGFCKVCGKPYTPEG